MMGCSRRNQRRNNMDSLTLNTIDTKGRQRNIGSVWTISPIEGYVTEDAAHRYAEYFRSIGLNAEYKCIRGAHNVISRGWYDGQIRTEAPWNGRTTYAWITTEECFALRRVMIDIESMEVL